jgi:hypothetical protein
MRPNAQYNVASPQSMAIRVAARMRRVMFRRFLEFARPGPGDLALDVGATSDRSYLGSNYFEAWYPYRDRVVAVGLDHAPYLAIDFPGVRYVRGDGLLLPFADESFDIVHSSAVIEHVGSRERQRRFILELCRVARRCVFVTTPNRFYPVEFHTLLPMLHWLPTSWFHAALRATGRAAFADESVLNLLDRAALGRIASASRWNWRVGCVRLFGLPSNLLLMLHRSETTCRDPRFSSEVQ